MHSFFPPLSCQGGLLERGKSPLKPLIGERCPVLISRLSISQSFYYLLHIASQSSRLEIMFSHSNIQAVGRIFPLLLTFKVINSLLAGNRASPFVYCSRSYQSTEAMGEVHHDYHAVVWGLLLDYIVETMALFSKVCISQVVVYEKRQFSSLYRWCPNMNTTRTGGTNCQTMKRNPITKCDLRFLIFTGNSKPQCCIISKSCRSKRNKLLANWHVHSGTLPEIMVDIGYGKIYVTCQLSAAQKVQSDPLSI